MHPIYLIKSYYNDIENGKYSAIRDAARAQALEAVTAQHMGDGLDADEAIDHLLDRVGHLIGSRARIIDKLNLIREIVASGCNLDKGDTLSDDDYLMILAGWATEMRGRYR